LINPDTPQGIHERNYIAASGLSLDRHITDSRPLSPEDARKIPEGLLHPATAEQVHQRNYVVATWESIGHHEQAAAIHEAGFLNASDPVAISFWIISIAMVASTVFFLMEAFVVKTGWKTSVHIGSLVTLVAAVHYFYMREYWVKFAQSPIVYRYIDWSITVPLQMVEFYLILSAVQPNLSGGIFWRLSIGTVAMLTFGYCGEANLMNPWMGFCLGMCGWFFILAEIFVGEASKVAAAADKANRHIKSAYNTMRLIVTLGWSIYPLGYFFGYLLRQWGDSPCNATYNLADFVNKIAFCLCIWHAAKKDTMDSLGQGH